MALKFLNKKGWHTGSLRNIENVWKAEQKHDAEQKKLDELRKQILEERERSEFRLLQEQAGLVPKQERLDFLYDSGLAVGKGSSDGFKALEPPPPSKVEADTIASKTCAPGALFEDKPQSANDAWRKLHSDPLLLIRQQEQEALSRIKNNPVQMAMIRKSVEVKESKHERKEHKKQHHKKSKREGKEDKKKKKLHKKSMHEKNSPDIRTDTTEGGAMSAAEKEERKKRSHRPPDSINGLEKNHHSGTGVGYGPRHKHRQNAPILSAEEKAARAREMQLDAELHEEQRWKRLKKASEADAREEAASHHASSSSGRNFLDAAHKSIYGAEKGGSSTIEESVRRRTYYLQGRSEHEGNAFRRR
ncbi:uncharacterized protein LOC143879139 isoform X2 [Tasmannia lanceolata]|uniref:uncharacterized protein LOC143879139 isoform X2 n=1 Tax=Tasmannia lanceolata TaxID=3420 RepID=UPI004063486F